MRQFLADLIECGTAVKILCTAHKPVGLGASDEENGASLGMVACEKLHVVKELSTIDAVRLLLKRSPRPVRPEEMRQVIHAHAMNEAREAKRLGASERTALENVAGLEANSEGNRYEGIDLRTALARTHIMKEIGCNPA